MTTTSSQSCKAVVHFAEGHDYLAVQEIEPSPTQTLVSPTGRVLHLRGVVWSEGGSGFIAEEQIEHIEYL